MGWQGGGRVSLYKGYKNGVSVGCVGRPRLDKTEVGTRDSIGCRQLLKGSESQGWGNLKIPDHGEPWMVLKQGSRPRHREWLEEPDGWWEKLVAWMGVE